MTTEIVTKLNKIAHAYWVDRDRRVTKWEGDFVTDMVKRFERYGNKTMVSDKQAAIVERISAKLA